MSQKIVGLFVAIIAVASAVKVPITVYYESLCPDSAKLITEQIYPAVKGELKDHVNIEWVPFGKSQFSTQGSDVMFTCHHGPNECYGNKVHACAIEHIQANSYQVEFTRESLTLDFINCMMKIGKNFPDNVYPGAKCARDNQINTWENIQTCANNTEGSQLLMKHGQTTNHFMNPLKSVPVVVFKNQYDAKVNDRAQSDFVGVLCSYISQPMPKICASRNSAVSIAAISAPFMGLLAYALTKLFN
ncbi:GILT-like protein 1 [Musca vetustissima]|uniref:GILT-like protein 1 n=1 Tax=Musca vetustissima TaxID=27455 RepID=UPI002AB708D2|nr:GILT-like protein 1 [Musca vetustissima]